MCGIAGLISPSPIEPELLLRMRDVLVHRGPDDAGIWVSEDKRVGLAHRRLAIIDLSPLGKQPMLDASGKFCVVFNGEIYNYRELRRELEACGHSFISTSDTEVLLEAYRKWDTDCLSHFEGMFAFALYDCTRGRLFVARDRAGEKPLFYSHSGGTFRFASELKALLADPSVPRKLDVQSLEFYLTYGYVPGERCILQGIHKLPPAHALTLDVASSERRTWVYWELPKPAANSEASNEELVLELEGLLRDSVKRRLIADVPVGILLSGGIDSSLVTALAAQVSSTPIKTFTITFPGHGTYDEGPHARLVAEHFGTQHTELPAEAATADLLPMLARQYDEPLCDSSMVPTFLVSKLVRQHATVALGGDGGDEVFGGYAQYRWLFQREQARRWVPAFARSLVGHTASRFLPTGFRGRNFLRGMSGSTERGITHANVLFDPRARAKLVPAFHAFAPDAEAPEAYKMGLCEWSRGLPGTAMAVDFRAYLPEDILVKVDRASMLASLEVRAPFLDHRIIEFAFSRVPNRLRATLQELKILPRRLAKRILPKKLNLQRKQGFSLPLNAWMKGNWGSYMESVLRDADPALFNRAAINQLFNWQRRGCSNGERIFALTLFELWRREYKIATV
jgi:asparagine synthase (glutamine-hydrolysing)